MTRKNLLSGNSHHYKKGNVLSTKKGVYIMDKKDFTTIYKLTREILDAHYELSKINKHKESSNLCKYYGYDKTYNIMFYGKVITIRQMVQEFDGVCKYTIIYLDNHKYRSHNIRYIESLHSVASYKIGVLKKGSVA